MEKIETQKTQLVTDAEVMPVNADSRAAVQDAIHLYLTEKVPSLPTNIFDLHSYDDDAGLLSTERIQTDALKMWSARLNEPDSSVPGRSWSLELAVAETPGKIVFGSRLSCFSRHSDFFFDPAVPRVYRELISQNLLYGDGVRLSRTPRDITSDDDVDWLVALINNGRRRRNIVALSADERGTCIINPNIFSDRLCGIAHVVRIFPDAAFGLSKAIGKYLSVFDSGIRIYRPTSKIEADEPLNHTLLTRHQLAKMDLDRAQRAIAMDCFRASVEGILQSRTVPTFAQIRTANATFRLAELRSAVNSRDVEALEQQIKASNEARMAAEAQAREALDLAIQEEIARREVEEQRNQEKARSMVLAARIRLLEQKAGEDDQIARPAGYDGVAGWVEAAFGGRMRLHPRALRGLRDAVFNDVDLVCDLLQLIAIEYVDSKRGNRDAWKRFEDGLKGRGVEYSKSISEERAGQQGDEYFVRYKNQKFFLEWHLKKGRSRDEKFDLRIYFFWDDEDEEVVIGFLPSHLDNRIT